MGRAFEYRKARKLKRWGNMARTFTKIGKESFYGCRSLISVIIPNGQTLLIENDKVLVVTTTENKKKILDIFKR